MKEETRSEAAHSLVVLVEGSGDGKPRKTAIPEKFKNLPLPVGPVKPEDLAGIPVEVECDGPFVWRPRRREDRFVPQY